MSKLSQLLPFGRALRRSARLPVIRLTTLTLGVKQIKQI